MHFAIPDTTDKTDGSGTVFTVFNLHINGAYHCSARYRQLLTFHEQLKKEFGTIVPSFPPKKFLSLSATELDERRLLLERYIQNVSQISEISTSGTFTSFLLNSQQENSEEKCRDVEIDVYLLNGQKVTVLVSSKASTDSVLELVASKIELPSEMVYYFGLYLIQNDDNTISVIRKLHNFESPFTTLRVTCRKTACRIVLRKSFWDVEFENDLLPNRVAMNLLFVQAVSEVDNGWLELSQEQLRHLDNLKQKGSKREYLRFVRTLKYYGYLHFLPCSTDYPKPDCPVHVAIGNKDLIMKIEIAPGEVKEFVFKITRMRCWRITSIVLPTTVNGDVSNVVKAGKSAPSELQKLELSFEYLISKDSLRWLSIHSDQAILMSICLQSVVDELMMKKDGRKMKTPGMEKSLSRSSSRDSASSSLQRSLSSDSGPRTPLSPTETHHSNGYVSSSISSVSNSVTSPNASISHRLLASNRDPVRKMQEFLSSKKNLMENSAFELIGDEEL